MAEFEDIPGLDEVDKDDASKKSVIGAEKKRSKGRVFFGVILFLIGAGIAGGAYFFIPNQSIPTVSSPNPEHNDALVHVQAPLSVESLQDPMFKVALEGVNLKRHVELFQQPENSDFPPEWSRELFATTPAEWVYFEDQSWGSNTVKIVGFTLAESLKNTLQAKIPLLEEDLQKLNEHGQKAFKVVNGEFYFGVEPQSPQLGDIRIHFSGIPKGTVSVVALQKGNTLTAGVGSNIAYGAKPASVLSANVSLGKDPILFWGAVVGGTFLALIGVLLMLIPKYITPSLDALPKDKSKSKAKAKEKGNGALFKKNNKKRKEELEAAFIYEEIAEENERKQDNTEDNIESVQQVDDSIGEDIENEFVSNDIATEPVDSVEIEETPPSEYEAVEEMAYPTLESSQLKQNSESPTAEASESHQDNSVHYVEEMHQDNPEIDFPEGVEIISPDALIEGSQLDEAGSGVNEQDAMQEGHTPQDEYDATPSQELLGLSTPEEPATQDLSTADEEPFPSLEFETTPMEAEQPMTADSNDDTESLLGPISQNDVPPTAQNAVQEEFTEQPQPTQTTPAIQEQPVLADENEEAAAMSGVDGIEFTPMGHVDEPSDLVSQEKHTQMSSDKDHTLDVPDVAEPPTTIAELEEAFYQHQDDEMPPAVFSDNEGLDFEDNDKDDASKTTGNTS